MPQSNPSLFSYLLSEYLFMKKFNCIRPSMKQISYRYDDVIFNHFVNSVRLHYCKESLKVRFAE